MRPTRGCLARLLPLMVALSCASIRPEPDLAEYGAAPLPVWSPLTEFEVRVITRALTKPNDEALLLLSFMLGGHVRTEEEARPGLEAYRSFAEAVQNDVASARSPKAKSERLLRRMHLDLLKTREQDASARGYREDQVRTDVLLEDGHFNCISSAIVYGLLAARFGLPSSLAIVPQHVFIVVTPLGQSTSIEVETTSIRGLAPARDDETFLSNMARWKKEGGVEPVGLADYRARLVVPLVIGITRLASEKRVREGLAEIDRRRLVEIAGLFNPDAAVQKARVSTWIQAAQEADEQDRSAVALAMLERLPGKIKDLVSAGPASPVAEPLAWLHIAWAAAEAEHGAVPSPRILANTRTALHLIAREHPDRTVVENNARYIGQTLVDRLLTQGRVPEVEDVCRDFQMLDCRTVSQPVCEAAYIQVGTAWFQQGLWKKAIAAFEDCVEVANTNREACRLNREAAYCNLANEVGKSGGSLAERSMLERCVATDAAAVRCRKRLQGERLQGVGLN